MTRLIIRPEQPADMTDIRAVNVVAFADHPYSQQTEHLIVEALRDAGALEISLVAEIEGSLVGHIAFSKASVGTAAEGWYLLGPIAVFPEHQHSGIGSALVEAGLALLRDRDASGCALVGDPGFYGRFGFRSYRAVTCEGVPDEYVLCLPLDGSEPCGEIVHHQAFFVQP